MLRYAIPWFVGITVCGSAHAVPLKCDIAAKYRCQPGGCESVQPSVWNIVDVEAKTYQRCDAKGCDTYPVSFT